MAFLLRAIGGVEEVHPAHGRPMFSIQELQALVGGYFETLRTIGGLWLVINEDGKRLALPPNERATGIALVSRGVLTDVIVGDVVLANSIEMGEGRGRRQARLMRKASAKSGIVVRPFIGPCRDPLRLWFLQWTDDRGTWRRYYADRTEARLALKKVKVGNADGAE